MPTTKNCSQAFSALGDKTRFKLYYLLGSRPEICVSQLAKELGITPACVSQHMKILSDAKLVKRVRDGQRVCYEISIETPSQNAIHQLVFNT